MGLSGQQTHPDHALAPGKETPVPIVQEGGWAPEPVQTQRQQEKNKYTQAKYSNKYKCSRKKPQTHSSKNKQNKISSMTMQSMKERG
jgi:hypothetical protein